MCDLNSNRAGQSSSQTIFNSVWLSKCSQFLAGKRGGFQALIWAAVVNLILFGIFLACATSVYETNDDLLMQRIASGFSHRPSRRASGFHQHPDRPGSPVSL